MAAPSTPTTISFVQAQPFALAGSGASIGDTAIILQSMVGIDGTNIVTADLGSFAYGTLEPGNGSQEEAILFTGVTQNANGTATLTGVSSIAFKQPYTLTTGLTKTHAGASKFIMSNDAAFYNNFVLYMNAIAGAGAANASTAVKGLVQVATTAQINSGTATGSTGAALSISPDGFINTTNNQYVSSIINTGIPYAVATGTSSAYTATLASSISTLASGTFLNFLVPVSNATGITLNINGLGAKSIKKNVNVTLASGDLYKGLVASVVFDGTNFQFSGPTSSLSATSSGNTTWDLSTTGAQNIAHGLGTIPKFVKITAQFASNSVINQVSSTYSNGTEYDISTAMAADGSFSNNGANSQIYASNGNFASYVITTDATNIILNKSKTGGPSGTAQVLWETIA